MGTSATIIFKDEFRDIYMVNRGSDGFPDIIIPDLEVLLEEKKGSWSGSEITLLVSSFIGIFYNREERLPDYVFTNGVRGDDSFQYYVIYDKEDEKWKLSFGCVYGSAKINTLLSEKKPIICQECFCETKNTSVNNYYCSSCDKDMIVSFDEDYFDFKINNEYTNVVFKEGD